jgi:class 3 adenylate cyclase/CHAT domain-containing protein/curli biogenesis system outer membrane secretion channel CsgG
MKNEEKDHTANEESLKELLQRRHDLDCKLENQYTRAITIMFTDIKGSTEFYELRGDIDGRVLFEKHNQILKSILVECRGRTVKSTGDGMLIVFDQPGDGVRASIALQKKLWEFNKEKRKQDQLHVRVSLNYGKVIEDEGDVYGLEVSIASRINSVANAGQILISESLYEEVRNANDIIFHPLPPVRVKGVQDPLSLYQVIWGNEEVIREFACDRTAARPEAELKRKVFIINVIKETGKIKISGYEKLLSEQKTVRHYEELRIDEEKISKYRAEIIGLLNRANQKGHVSRDILNKLKASGHLLFDELFSVELKSKLAGTMAEDLIISIDDNLVDIPWELLYDGKSFLCIRFNMGRLVSTRQRISEATPRTLKLPLKMLVLSNPQGNLKSAYREGFSIRDKLEYLENSVQINVKSNNITSGFVMENIRNFDILHYSGHADYDSNDPSESGFLLENGKFSASDIISLIGNIPLPSLVFSNACKSGHTDKWTVGEHYGKEIYGLANAFLLAGVNHYIGTFWDVQDEPGLYFALAFYSELMRGVMIGEAVRKARQELIRKYGEDTIIWASYMLYGDPTSRYVELITSEEHETKAEKHPEREPEEALSGNTRSIGSTATLPVRNRTWLFAGSALLVLICAAALFSTMKTKTDIPVQQALVPAVEISKEEQQKRIDELVSSLAEGYRKGMIQKKQSNMDEWTSGQLTMVLMDVKSSGTLYNDSGEKLKGLLPVALQKEQRIHFVERELLDKLLAELKLSTTDLADPSTALKIGRLLSARIIITGSIIAEKNASMIILRCIDTETSEIKKVISAESSSGEIDRNVIDDIGRKIIDWVRSDFPLQGRIVSVSGDTYGVNLGQVHGLKNGDRLELVQEARKGSGMYAVTGEVELHEVGKNRSSASNPGAKFLIKEGDRVREKKGTK